MKLVAWNCCDAFRPRKLEAIRALEPDVLVLSEVRRSSLDVLSGHAAIAWVGAPNTKGLGIVAFNGWKIEPLPELSSKYFLPVFVHRGAARIFLLGVWAHPTPYYVSSLQSAIAAAQSLIATKPAILAGDFNQSVVFDSRYREGLRFATVLKGLSELGLKSAWHEHRAEAHGAETARTYFHRRKRNDHFHIDFVFASPDLLQTITATSVGTFDDWVATDLSDHTPIAASFEVGR